MALWGVPHILDNPLAVVVFKSILVFSLTQTEQLFLCIILSFNLLPCLKRANKLGMVVGGT